MEIMEVMTKYILRFEEKKNRKRTSYNLVTFNNRGQEVNRRRTNKKSFNLFLESHLCTPEDYSYNIQYDGMGDCYYKCGSKVKFVDFLIDESIQNYAIYKINEFYKFDLKSKIDEFGDNVTIFIEGFENKAEVIEFAENNNIILN